MSYMQMAFILGFIMGCLLTFCLTSRDEPCPHCHKTIGEK